MILGALHDAADRGVHIRLLDVYKRQMQAGKGAGYARWAKVFNLKQMAKAMMFMEEHGIKSLSLIHISYASFQSFLMYMQSIIAHSTERRNMRC